MTRRLTLAFLALYLLTASGRIDSGDGHAMFQVTDSLLHGRGFVISAAASDQDWFGPRGERIPRETVSGSGYGSFGVGGQYYARYGPGQSFVAVPFYLMGELAHVVFPSWSEEFLTRTSVTLLNAVVTALTVVLVMKTARLFFSETTALMLAILFGLATPAWPYAKTFFSEPLLGGFILLSGYAAMQAKRKLRMRWWVLSGAALGAASLVKLTALSIAPAVTGYLLIKRHPTRWMAWLGALVVALALSACYNLVRFGDPLVTGYGEVGWDTPLWLGVYGLLLSSGRGLLWFAPIVVLGIVALPAFIHRARADGVFVVGAACLFIAMHSIYARWEGGGCWGPRLIVPIVPWLMLPVGVVLERRPRAGWQQWGMAVVIAASIIVQVLGVSVNPGRYFQEVYNTSHSSEEYFDRVQFRWADAPIVGQGRALLTVTSNVRSAQTRAELHALVERTLAASSSDPFYDARSEVVGLLAFNVPDLWFVYFWFLGLPVGWLVGVALMLLGIAAATLWRLRRG